MADEKKKAAAAAPKVQNAPKADGDFVVTHLVVAAKKDGFRRAGRVWSAAPTTVAADEFSDAEIEQLLAEPMLVVTPAAAADPAEATA